MKNIVSIVLVMACTNFIQPILAQDSLVYVRSNPFLTNLLGEKEYTYPIYTGAGAFLKFTNPLFNERGQSIIKTQKSCYVVLNGSGFLFRLENPGDSILRFKRIEKTVNINYNQGAYIFHEGQDIYSYGGYGFWKNNGTLRKFSFQAEEWDVEPLSAELYPQISPLALVWFDPVQRRLYLPFQSITNAGLKDRSHIRGKFIDGAHYLSLKTLDWTQMGKTNEKVIEMMRVASLVINTNRGPLILWNEDLCLLNYTKNEVRKLKDPHTAQSAIKLTNTNTLTYHKNTHLYTYQSSEQKYDSIPLDLDTFESIGQPIYKSSLNPLLFVVLGVMGFAAVFGVRKYDLTKTKTKEGPLVEHTAYQVSFSDVEKSLLSMFIQRAKNKQTAVITDINYILGVKEKNTGLQKKVRSDVFNSINEKYRYITKQNDPLIQSIRSAMDKRYFEYFINPDQAKELEQLL